MKVVVEPLPECIDELEDLIDNESEAVVKSVSKLFQIWEEREDKGFEIDGLGQILDLSGPNGATVTVIVHRFPSDRAAGIVAVDQQGKYARILKVGKHRNQYQIDTIYKEGLFRLKDWILNHGSLQ